MVINPVKKFSRVTGICYICRSTFLHQEVRCPMAATRFIVYEGDGEVLVTTERLEKAAVEEWFTHAGRVIEEYDRVELGERTAVGVTITGFGIL